MRRSKHDASPQANARPTQAGASPRLAAVADTKQPPVRRSAWAGQRGRFVWALKRPNVRGVYRLARSLLPCALH